MNLLREMKRNLRDWQYQIGAIKTELVFRRLIRAAVKAGYNDSEDRDELGRWASAGGVEVTTTPGFFTGIPTIDDTSQALSDTLVSVMETVEYLPEMSPGAYGVAVHTAFGAAVRAQNLPGVGDIERTFSLDTIDPVYGLAGSIRTDVTLRDATGEIVAIYDVKTGNARISQGRADELREKTRSAPNTPVFELNIVKGISRKSDDWIVCSLHRAIVPDHSSMGRF